MYQLSKKILKTRSRGKVKKLRIVRARMKETSETENQSNRTRKSEHNNKNTRGSDQQDVTNRREQAAQAYGLMRK